MPVCSYLVIPERGAEEPLARRLSALEGCDVAVAENRNLLLLVTDTPTPDADRALRDTIETLPGLQGLVLAFGEIDPDTEQADPIAEDRRGRRKRLPVVDPGGLNLPNGPESS
jgi:nitrate reductase NapAB chaperone NapD